MNERIKEIEKQCWKSIQIEPYALFDSKKFAKLIVEECAWLVDENDISLPYGTFGKLIKGHFGVEE
jgi:hypothetical protein